MAPNVSVCIHTYDRKHLLKETLESIFAQSYKDFEVVVVDDGSADGTKQMIDEAGYKLRYCWQENAGDAAARNKLIKLAHGRYISFLDSDDLLWPNALKRMVEAVPTGREDVIIYGPYVAIDEQGNILRRKKKKLYSGRITEYLFENILVHSCGSMFPKEALLEIGGFNESLPVCSDYDLWLRLSLKYDFAALSEPIFKRRRHSGNISKICFANRNTELRVLEGFYYKGGGKDVIAHKRAMRRFGKEQYRAGRTAIMESMWQTAREYFKDSLKRCFDLKTLLWLFIAHIRLFHSRWKTEHFEKQETSAIATAGHKSISEIKIAVDFNPVLINKFSGFYTFGTGLLQGYTQLEEKPELLLFHSNRFSSRVEEVVKNELRGITQLKTAAVKMRWLEQFWNHFDYPKLQSLTGEFDIYHCFHHLMPPTEGKPKIMTIYDLRRYKLPQLYRKSKLVFFETAVRRADHFMAISEATKNDLCDIFGISENKVDIVPLASGIKPVELSSDRKEQIKLELSGQLGHGLKDYLIVISSPDSRKNIKRTVDAFQAVQSELPEDLKLLIIGQLPKRESDFVRRLKSNNYKNVFCTGTVDDLWPWLVCAKALVFASLYEGFGIPILEAFACDLPVITSNCSSMPQVAGDAAMYVDPYDVDSIAQAIVKVCNNTVLRDKLIQSGRKRNKQFSWKNTAEKTVEVYKKFL